MSRDPDVQEADNRLADLERIPRELFEALRMDEDSFFTMFWRIAAPLA